jgi:hypothetical protein
VAGHIFSAPAAADSLLTASAPAPMTRISAPPTFGYPATRDTQLTPGLPSQSSLVP